MKKWEREELEKLKVLQLKKLALELELPMVKSKAELIESILREGTERETDIYTREKAPGSKKKAVKTESGRKKPAKLKLRAKDSARSIVRVPRKRRTPAGTGRAVLLAVNPGRLFAFWEIEKTGKEISDSPVLRLREDGRKKAVKELKLDTINGSLYLDALPGRSYQAEIGLLGKTGGFSPKASSMVVKTPAKKQKHPEQWQEEKNMPFPPGYGKEGKKT
ncbi:MAG: DUF4912 domain-containing protein [Nitrospiraceae bacterium]|nr:DUF4912 domain-containing protein [Nitrospiraceae bacterium]